MAWLKRAGHTAWQAAAAAAIVAVGNATMTSEVNWVMVLEMAGLAAILSALKSLAVGVPEVPPKVVNDGNK